jgi:hypothetical protein
VESAKNMPPNEGEYLLENIGLYECFCATFRNECGKMHNPEQVKRHVIYETNPCAGKVQLP